VQVVVISVGRLREPYADDVGGRLPRDAFVSLLAAEGEAFDSVGFARFIEARRESGRDLVFVIGGAHGLELPQADHRLSLGSMTLPHQLARVVLLEALFRAHKILSGEPYHY
jgi:23S rRNA (pseudouridine1915-N3)-methyltransferase